MIYVWHDNHASNDNFDNYTIRKNILAPETHIY